ncbi:DUF1592 domain-containing protein [Rubripirellula reticaptiva]|uniref:Planctomycete cytochrome C n=1 Tax=Rubripirellula reticaptiva TaxID=2528013 RepID=A0A5C6EV71_9BACT|nr:DUF1592 domain-containing protein [Rubripirellula reticaptiva]TWU51957.1 hypothetical protein Poly59_35540 [Rubripirellula reticaptiva]
MIDFRIVSLAALIVAFLSHDQTTVAETNDWKTVGWPLLQKYCIDCHNADNAEAEWDLSSFENFDDVDGGANSMQRVLEMVRFGAMPPEDSDLPTDQERKALVKSLDETMFAVSCDLRPRPGKVTARRLNRTEYNNTIRDLFGMDLRPADQFPSDETGAGFDNNGDVMSMSPLMIEKYLTAAEQVAAAVIVDPETIAKLDEDRPSDQLLSHGDLKVGSFFGRFMKPDSFVWANFDVKMPGEYLLKFRGGVSEKKSGDRIAAVFDDAGKLVGTMKLGYFGGGGGASSGQIKVNLAAGRRRLMICYFDKDEPLQIGKTYRKDFDSLDPDWVKSTTDALKTPRKPDRDIDLGEYSVMFRSMSLTGPAKLPDEAFPPTQKMIVRKVAPRRGSSWYDVDESAEECLRPLMRRAFRGPVSDEEVARYADLALEAKERGESYYRGLQISVAAVLVSPRFLFRVETPDEDELAKQNNASDPVALTQHQLATRLSYFLWSSMPDETLLDLADRGKLTPKEIPKQIERMLKDPKSNSLASEFASQWLGVRKLAEHEADTTQFKTFGPALKAAMAKETELVFDHVLRMNRPASELLTADYSYLNADLAKHYAMPKEIVSKLKNDKFEKVSLDGMPRRGVLSHASVLTLTSNPNRTSPVGRGKWILENVLGTPPPEPPPGVPQIDEAKTSSAGLSFREQLEQHRSDPSCASCHRVMDQLGFGLEEFDAVGRFRTTDGGKPIDASGEMPGRRNFNGAVELSKLLGSTESESFARTATSRLLTFALGRELTPSDRCTIDAIIEKTAKNDFRFGDLIFETILSPPFQYYDWIEPGNETTTSAHSNSNTNLETELN